MNAQAQAWREITRMARDKRLDPADNKFIADLISRHTRDGYVPTREEAQAEEQKGREYVYAETMDGRYPEIGD